MTVRNFTKVLVPMSAMAFVVSTAFAQLPAAQPMQGQSPEQMQKDMADCQGIAKQSSGHDPTQVTTQAAPAEPEVGGRARGAAKAATASAVATGVKGRQHEEVYNRMSDDAKQEYRQNQAGSAAAAGAVVGASRQRQDRREQAQAQEQQTAQATAAANSYNQAYKSCMMGRGYSVP